MLTNSLDTQEAIQAQLLTFISDACGLPPEALDQTEPIIDLGLDSIIAANVSAELDKLYGIELPIEHLVNGASIAEISQVLFETLTERAENPGAVLTIAPPSNQLTKTQRFTSLDTIPESFHAIGILPHYKRLTVQKTLFQHVHLDSPFYIGFDSASTATIQYQEKTLINFGSYNYLGFNGDPGINQAAINATLQYGTSASSSRIVGGEKTIHKQLEQAIADLYEVDDAIVFVSGYSTNVGVISHLMGENDLIIHDSLAHNSIILGSEYSGAKRLAFPHNDLGSLEQLLMTNRLHYDRVLLIVEGLYSMDGDIPPLVSLVALKNQYRCLLMVDEAHSIGVLGNKGFGIREMTGVSADDVDIWMGTLSKSFAGCGGYIAGCQALVEYLKYSAPHFIFSVGLAPPVAAASLAAIERLKEDPTPVSRLRENSRYFLEKANSLALDTGLAMGYAIVPVILKDSLKTALLANQLFARNIHAQPIIYPGVDEHAARLRFFITALHTKDHIDTALQTTQELLEANNKAGKS